MSFSEECEVRFVILGFRREEDETCALLGCYAACSGNSLPTFRDSLSDPIFKGQGIQEEKYMLKKVPKRP